MPSRPASAHGLGLVLPLEEVPLVLDADEPGPPAGRRLGLAQLGGAEVRAADLPHLALLYKFVQHAERVGDRRRVVRSVQLVEVDPVGAQLGQTPLDRRAHVRRGGSARTPVDGAPELRADDDLVPPRPERRGQARLALEVGVGGIEEGDTGLERGVDDRRHGVRLHEEAEVVGPESDDRDLERADPSCVHDDVLPGVVPRRTTSPGGGRVTVPTWMRDHDPRDRTPRAPAVPRGRPQGPEGAPRRGELLVVPPAEGHDRRGDGGIPRVGALGERRSRPAGVPRGDRAGIGSAHRLGRTLGARVPPRGPSRHRGRLAARDPPTGARAMRPKLRRQHSAWGFDTLGLEEIVSIHEPDNVPSGRVMDRLGFGPAWATVGPRQGHPPAGPEVDGRRLARPGPGPGEAQSSTKSSRSGSLVHVQ